MAECKKCDRCGKMYEYYNRNYSKHKRDMNGIAGVCVNKNGTAYMTTDDMVMDLCEECLTSFKNWWDENKIVLSDECIKDFEEKNCRPPEERTDIAHSNINDVPDPIIIQEPESDGEKYGY